LAGNRIQISRPGLNAKRRCSRFTQPSAATLLEYQGGSAQKKHEQGSACLNDKIPIEELEEWDDIKIDKALLALRERLAKERSSLHNPKRSHIASVLNTTSIVFK
jgi:hypothetical protein